MRLFENDCSVKLYTVPNLSHGFMYFNLPFGKGIPEVALIKDLIGEIIDEIRILDNPTTQISENNLINK